MVLLKRGQLWRIPFFDLSSGHIDKCCHKVPTILRTEGTNAAIGRNGSWVQYHIILKERCLLGTDIAIAGQCRSTLKESTRVVGTWYWHSISRTVSQHIERKYLVLGTWYWQHIERKY